MKVHPYLNHFPIAFFLLELFLLILWRRKKDEAYERFAYFVLRLAVLSMPFVMIAGVLDARGLPPMVRLHFILAVCLFVFSSVRLVFRWRLGRCIWASPGVGSLYFFSAVANVLLTVVAAHFGGLLVYG